MYKLSPFKIGRYGFPVQLSQIEDLLGKCLTHVEAMGLRESVEKANKDLIRQTIWKWFDGVQENSLTSYKDCWAPIYGRSTHGELIDDGLPQTDRWGYKTPEEFLKAIKEVYPDMGDGEEPEK